MKSSFFIVADRGNLKAFRVEKTPAERHPHLELVQAYSLTDVHTKISEANTDLAGGHPFDGSAGGGGRHQNSISERHYDIEQDRRSAKQLAELITGILKQENPASWSFAIPSEMKQPVLDQLDNTLRSRLAETVARDLVNVHQQELLGHFSEVRAA